LSTVELCLSSDPVDIVLCYILITDTDSQVLSLIASFLATLYFSTIRCMLFAAWYCW